MFCLSSAETEVTQMDCASHDSNCQAAGSTTPALHWDACAGILATHLDLISPNLLDLTDGESDPLRLAQMLHP